MKPLVERAMAHLDVVLEKVCQPLPNDGGARGHTTLAGLTKAAQQAVAARDAENRGTGGIRTR
jgi:hypothetical protein